MLHAAAVTHTYRSWCKHYDAGWQTRPSHGELACQAMLAGWPPAGHTKTQTVRTSIEPLAHHDLKRQDAQGKHVHGAISSYRRLTRKVSSGNLFRCTQGGPGKLAARSAGRMAGRSRQQQQRRRRQQVEVVEVRIGHLLRPCVLSTIVPKRVRLPRVMCTAGRTTHLPAAPPMPSSRNPPASTRPPSCNGKPWGRGQISGIASNQLPRPLQTSTNTRAPTPHRHGAAAAAQLTLHCNPTAACMPPLFWRTRRT